MPKTTPSVQTPESIEALAGELDSLVRRLRSVRETMKTHRLDKVLIRSGKSEMVRGLTRIHYFVQVAEDTMRQHREDRGDFGLPAPKKRGKNKHSAANDGSV